MITPSDRSEYARADNRRRMRLSVCMANALRAAQEIHAAMCFIDDRAAIGPLLHALKNALIIAEECQQGWSDKVPRPKMDDEP